MSAGIVDDDDLPEIEDYPELNVLASSTTLGYKSAVEMFNRFAKYQDKPLLTHLNEKNVCGVVLPNGSMSNPIPPIQKVFGQYAHWLLVIAKKKDGTHYQPGTVAQYFSSLKAILFKKHPPLKYGGENPDWYEELYHGLKMRASVECIKRGGTVSKKAVGFARAALANSCEFLMGQDNQSLGYEERLVLLMLFHAVGRGGEVSTSTWDSARWDEDREFLELDWGEFKKGQQQIMTFHPDAKNWRLCIYHAFACYLLTSSGGNKASTTRVEAGISWILASYVDMREGGAATKAGKILKKCRDGGVKGIPEESGSHGIRVAATDCMIFNHLLQVFDVIARGNWDFKSDNLAFHYFTQKLHVVCAGKALAGYYDPQQHVCAPTLKACVTSENTLLVDQFCQRLFSSVDIPGFNDETSALHPFRDIMVASLLMYYDDVSKTLGSKSLLIASMHIAANDVGIKGIRSTLSAWGKAILTRFRVTNAHNLGDVGDSDEKRFGKMVSELQRNWVEQGEKMNEMRAETNERLAGIEDKLSRALDMLIENSCGASSSTPSKRQRTGEALFSQSPMPVPPQISTNSTDTATSSLTSVQLQAPSDLALTSFDNCLDWTCARFIHDCAAQKQHPTQGTLFIAHLRKQDRSKAKMMFEELQKYATEEEKDYFDFKKRPVDIKLGLEWLKKINECVPRMAQDLLEDAIRGRNPDITDGGIADKKRKMKKNSVSSYASQLQGAKAAITKRGKAGKKN
mmetsp:Transcript_19499/g.42365  ORF Transcript_19499/g.42365 Transcript_19499/m.42365 type:complete len:741 (+) Transcript_19499:209-2431(+)